MATTSMNMDDSCAPATSAPFQPPTVATGTPAAYPPMVTPGQPSSAMEPIYVAATGKEPVPKSTKILQCIAVTFAAVFSVACTVLFILAAAATGNVLSTLLLLTAAAIHVFGIVVLLKKKITAIYVYAGLNSMGVLGGIIFFILFATWYGQSKETCSQQSQQYGSCLDGAYTRYAGILWSLGISTLLVLLLVCTAIPFARNTAKYIEEEKQRKNESPTGFV